MRTLGFPAIALAVLLTWEPPHFVSAQSASDEAERIQKAIEVLKDLTTAPDESIPQYLLERAEAIVVIPNLVKGGFVVGAKHGKGVVSIRDRAANTWSYPVFLKMTGGSIGWQIGAESVDLVLLVMNRKGVEDLLDDKFTLGGNLSVSAGPVGRSADAATNVKISSQILAYSRSRGLFAGATLEGGALRGDDDANRAFYGREVSLRALVKDKPERASNSAAQGAAAAWLQTLRSLTRSK